MAPRRPSAPPPEQLRSRPADSDLTDPRTVTAFSTVQRLVRLYLGVSILTLAVIVALRNHASEVNSAVWTRGVIVVATALLLVGFARRAARGSRGAYRRLRIVSILTPVAIAVIIAVPGTFPLWMKIDQGICGAVMIAVAVIANGPHLRAVFSSTSAG